MKTKRETPKRGRGNDRRRGRDAAARTSRRTPAEAASRRSRPGKVSTPEARGHHSGPQTGPNARPVERSNRPKSTRQAKARAKARKAKAPKVIRPRLTERLAMRLASIDLRPRTLLSKVPFVVLIIGALGLGLGLTLWLSTDSAERSYRLSHAREKNRMLQQQAESLEREVREAEAAPALAEAARKQGMIPTRDTAHLVQDASGTWVVVGTPKPADGVPPPPLNSKLPDAGPAAPPKPVAPPAEIPVRIEPVPGAAPAPTRSGPEALLRAPDGSTTVGGQHIPQTAPLPGMPGGPATGQPPVAMPMPGLPAPAAPEVPGVPNQLQIPMGATPVPAQAPVPMPGEVPVPMPRGIAPPAPRVGGPLIPGASVLPPAAPVAPGLAPNSGQQVMPPAAPMPGAPR